MKTITITIQAMNKYTDHKLIIDPSVAVNPPYIQYFEGVNRAFNGLPEIDNRYSNMKAHVIRALSSILYPNPPICSESRAEKIARVSLRTLLKKIDKSKSKEEFLFKVIL